MPPFFQTRRPYIAGNADLREPQQGAFQALERFASKSTIREAAVILPVGCGKSGTIALTPFAFKAARTLVVAPGVAITEQLHRDFDPSNVEMFYKKRNVITQGPWLEPVRIQGDTANIADLEEADVVVANIGQLQGAANKWLTKLPADFFDLILFDEGHHAVAQSWMSLMAAFPKARVVNFSATPLRADGKKMGGQIVYTYPVSKAIQEGFVKRLSAVVLNPKTLKYVRREDDVEIEVNLAEVKRLGESDADFRRSILTSAETRNTIVDASIRALERLRAEGGDKTLKIIASALNYRHCIDVVEAYRSRGRRAEYVHSNEDGAANARVMRRLEADDLDVIVQVRKLSEGFDHPKLVVAAVFNIFANLSPFIQFVGRIMRVIKQNEPSHILNRGIVVFHAGANIAKQWSDFQAFSEADQEYFEQLLPIEDLDFSSSDELTIEPPIIRTEDSIDIRSQSGVQIEEIPLIEDDPAALALIKQLQSRGYSGQQVADAMAALESIPVTKVSKRRAHRSALDERIKNEVGRILGERRIPHEGKTLDSSKRGRSNFVVLKSALDKAIARHLGHKTGQRSQFTQADYDAVEKQFGALVGEVERQVFNG